MALYFYANLCHTVVMNDRDQMWSFAERHPASVKKAAGRFGWKFNPELMGSENLASAISFLEVQGVTYDELLTICS